MTGAVLDYGLERASVAISGKPQIEVRTLLEHCQSKSDSEHSLESADSGNIEAVRVDDGFLALVHDRRFAHDFVSTAKVDGWLSIHFRLQGSSTHVFGDLGQLRRSDRNCMVVAYPDGMLNCELFDAGSTLKAVALAVHPDYLAEGLGIAPEDMPDGLARWARGERSEFFRTDFVFTGEMNQAVADLVGSPYAGTLRYRHCQARSLHLLCLVAHALMQRRDDCDAEIRLTQNERHRISNVQALLVTRFDDIATISELARCAGMSRTMLQRGFRQMFGTTINEYRVEARMAKAYELLRASDSSIGQVARAVGYDHANNFAAAFRRRFGVLPRHVRHVNSRRS